LNDIDSLKTLLAQNTIKSLYTYEDEEPIDMDMPPFKSVVEGATANINRKSIGKG
jgi:hypothetical protein